MQSINENESVGNKINEFVQRNRKTIFISLSIIVFLLAGLVITLSLNDVFRKKAIAEVEELEKRYKEVRPGLNDDSSASDVETLIADVTSFASKKSGLAGGKAWTIIAQIHSEKKEWPQAEEAWIAAAKAAAKTFMEPVSYYKAAVAAEEQGKREEAIQLYEKCTAVPVEFPQAPRAQFAIGRLYEEMNDVPAAIEAYREIFIKWPAITTWVNLARSRIIVLETR
ncbi:MAG: tetratricopeptide repeat protein [Treponema sp.]|jgi:tetratricopeptide (TPR) repeat protein|nr:tetratricopeptide repeat protein [Treponema sp.]